MRRQQAGSRPPLAAGFLLFQPRERVTWVLLLFIVLFAPLDTERTGSFYAFTVLTIAAAAALAIHASGVWAGARPVARTGGIPFAFLLLSGWCALLLAVSVDRAASEYGLMRLFQYGTLLVVAPAAFGERRLQEPLWKVAVVLAAVLSAAGLAQFVLPIGLHGPRAHSLFVTPNSFAGFLLVPLAVSVALSLAGRQPKARLLWGGCALLILAAFAASGSRGAWLALAASLALGAVAARRRRDVAASLDRRRARVWLLAAAVCLALVSLQAVRSREIAERFASLGHLLTAEPDRLRYWSSALDIVRTRPWTGYGPGTFHLVYKGFQAPELEGTLQVHAHNDYLQVAAEAGLPGLGLMLLLAGLVAAAGRAALRDGRDAVAAGIALGTWAVLLHSLVDFNFQIPATQVLFWLGAAYLSTGEPAGEERATAQGPGRAVSRRARRAAAAAAFALAALACASAGRAYLADRWSARGYERLRAGDIEPARRWFARAVRLVPYSSYHLAGLAKVDLLEGEAGNDPGALRAAVALLEEALRRSPYDYHARVLLGQLYSRNLELLGADARPRLVEVLEEGAALLPSVELFPRQLGRVLLEGGDAARAAGVLEEHLARNPGDAAARAWLAEARLRAGDDGLGYNGTPGTEEP